MIDGGVDGVRVDWLVGWIREDYSDSSDRLKEFRVRVRSDLAINAAAGFMRRIQP